MTKNTLTWYSSNNIFCRWSLHYFTRLKDASFLAESGTNLTNIKRHRG